MTVITKVFPDEYHLHTLHQILSAIARLNPHVDMKKIVIGLMDRLAAFAQRQEEDETSPADKQKAEQEATARLLQNLQVSKEPREQAPNTVNGTDAEAKANGTTVVQQNDDSNQPRDKTTTAGEENTSFTTRETKRNVIADVKLYEIFYEQVVSLVKTRGLSIHDTLALLTSLVNLAL